MPIAREDVIEPTAFNRTIQRWRASTKTLPLLHEHSTIAIGFIDPHSMHPTEEGLVAAGEVDRETAEGRQVWKQIKSGSIGFSIGYMCESTPRKGGGRRITEIDLLEVSAVSTPMNAETRALSWKSTTPPGPLHDVLWGVFHPDDWDNERSRRRDSSDLRREKELKAILDRVEAKEAREAKRNRPIHIAKFDV